MKKLALRRAAGGIAVVMAAAVSGYLPAAVAGDGEYPAKLPVHYHGLINDYTPSAAVVKGGPYEMRGRVVPGCGRATG